MKGSSLDTTSSRMELTAAIEALKMVKSGNPVFVRSKSQYVVQSMVQWLSGWKAKGWLKADKTPVPNRELWEELDVLTESRSVTWERVSGNDHGPARRLAGWRLRKPGWLDGLTDSCLNRSRGSTSSGRGSRTFRL